MGGVAKKVGEFVANTPAVASLGMIDPNKDKPFSGGVFQGKAGAADYGQSLGHHVTLGTAMETPGRQEQERESERQRLGTAAATQTAQDDEAAAQKAEQDRLTESPQEAWDARKRASGVAERLGIRGRRRTASDTFLGGPQGPL